MKEFKKTTIALTVLAAVVLIASMVVLRNDLHVIEVNDFETCVSAGNPIMESYPRQCRDKISEITYTELIIGGERDKHGCLGPAGYSWNETLQVCLREWEVTGFDRQILESAMNYTRKEYSLTFINITKADCNGCFVIWFNTINSTKSVDVIGVKFYCSEEQRGPGVYCIQVYEPVCGSDNKTYSNSCIACLNNSVEFYLE